MEKLDRITTNAARMNCEPCIRDLRLAVRRVLEALAVYPDRAELKREYPELEDEDIRQAPAFAAALVDDSVLPFPTPDEAAARSGPPEFHSPPSPVAAGLSSAAGSAWQFQVKR